MWAQAFEGGCHEKETRKEKTMKYTFDPKTGGMSPKKDPSRDIQDALRRDSGIEPGHQFTDTSLIRENLAVCTENGNHYCVVRINGQWRCLGRITDMAAIRRASYGPLVDFHIAWQSGVKVADPRDGE